MDLKKIIYYIFILSTFTAAAQPPVADSVEYIDSGCNITQTKQKLNRCLFASTDPIQLRVNNEKFVYATFQLGKRKKRIYLYLRIQESNVCIKKERNVDVYFKSGEVITLKNQYPLNCDGFFARQLNKKELRKLHEHEISMIKIYTYRKNYEMYIDEQQNHDIRHYIYCLCKYKIRRMGDIKAENNHNSNNREEDHNTPTDHN